MKKLTRFLGSFIFALALSSAAWTQSRPNQVVDQMIQALGGPAFLDVKEIHTSGRFFSFSRGGLSGGDFYLDYIKFAVMVRTGFGRARNRSITINKGGEGGKMDGKEW